MHVFRIKTHIANSLPRPRIFWLRAVLTSVTTNLIQSVVISPSALPPSFLSCRLPRTLRPRSSRAPPLPLLSCPSPLPSPPNPPRSRAPAAGGLVRSSVRPPRARVPPAWSARWRGRAPPAGPLFGRGTETLRARAPLAAA